ncbi:MAG: sterol desaturase family protein [Thermoleophilia bacterium]|nr:sterol desaturase family protein [Thermoleophilia bacterium]
MGSSERTSKLAASPDLFENGLLNFFSRVHPSVPALIFTPVIAAMFWLAAEQGSSGLAIIGLAVAGIAIWTFSEYWLHRLLFHWQPKFRGGDQLNFIIHGVHHDHPNDAMRLVMPPAASIPLAAIFFGAFVLVFGTPAGYPAFAGFLIGYLIYDYTHYAVHHFTPRGSIGKNVREHHMRHHFQDHHYGYGVSTPLWDYVFRTVPRSRKSERA